MRGHRIPMLYYLLLQGYAGAQDLAIILLAEVAAEHDEDFRVHLPVLLHAVVATLAEAGAALDLQSKAGGSAVLN